jgi:DNA-binding transcriptional ArsR family regulator
MPIQTARQRPLRGRLGVLEQLGRGDASITEFAEKFHMTLTGMKKHVGVLEWAGLVTTKKVGRMRTCKLGQRGLEEVAAWIEMSRQLWVARFDELDKVVEELKQKEKVDGQKRESDHMKNRTTVERKSERELVMTRAFNGSARIVFEAWTKPELLKRWWVRQSQGKRGSRRVGIAARHFT